MITGFIAGAFDLIHPGYIKMFQEAKYNCDYLIVGLHSDPTLERPQKLKPVLSFYDRHTILAAIRFIDMIVPYDTETDLVNLLINTKPDIRFLGDDYVNKNITGSELNIPIHYLDRSHGWSTTLLKEKIKQSLQ